MLRADVARQRLPHVGGKTPSQVLVLLAKASVEGTQIKPNQPVQTHSTPNILNIKAVNLNDKASRNPQGLGEGGREKKKTLDQAEKFGERAVRKQLSVAPV